MKNLKQILCCILFAALALPACKDKNDPQPVTQPDPEPMPTANFSFERKVVEPGDTVYFTNTSEHTKSYEWDFGNDSTSVEENPFIIYSETGIYTIKLTAIGQEGQRLEKAGTVKVGERYLTRISANNVPLTNGNVPWDTDGSGPDIQFRIWPSDSTVFLYKSPIHQNLDQSTVSLDFPKTIKFTDTRWQLVMVDVDSAHTFDLIAVRSFFPLEEGEIDYETGSGIIKTSHPSGMEVEFELR